MLLSVSVMAAILVTITAPGLIAQALRTRREPTSSASGENSNG